MDSGPLLLEGSEESYAGKRLVRVTEKNYSLCISSWGSKRASCRKLKWKYPYHLSFESLIRAIFASSHPLFSLNVRSSQSCH